MRASLGTPQIIVAADSGAAIINDCACADDGFGLAAPPAAAFDPARAWRRADQLWSAALSEPALVVFDPLAQAGPLVLNHDAWRLLGRFEHATTLDQALGDLDADERALARAACRALAAAELLRPADDAPAPRRAAPRTLTAWLHLTNECNLRCSYCYVNKTPDPMEVATGRRSVEAVFRSATRQGFRRVQLKFAGGEATLNFALIVLLRDYAAELAARHGIELDPVVLSNGVGLTRAMIGELKRRGIRLMISLDGLGEAHDAQRVFANGAGSFRSVARTIERLLAHDLRPCLSIVVSNRNLAGLAEVVGYALDRQLPFSLNFYRENACAASHADLAYAEAQIIAAMRTALRVIEGRLPPWSMLDAILDRVQLHHMHERACGVGQSYMVIDQRGGIAKCHMTIEQTLTDVAAADPLALLQRDPRGIQNLPVEEKDGCRECAWRYWCAGGCPLMTHRATGRWDVKSPNCAIYQALFPDVLRLEGLRLLRYGRPVALDS